MKCYFRVGPENWRKGEITSLCANTTINFWCRENGDRGPVTFSLSLSNYEINFAGGQFCVTGFWKQPDGLYQIISVDVRTTKPRELRCKQTT